MLILLIAAFLRFTAFGESPPGLQHDEMFKALEGRRLIESGDFRVFYPSNQGHEGGYVWLLGVSTALLGFGVIAVKFPAFVCGMLTVALVIRLAGKLAGTRAAVIAGGLTAVTFWAVFTSRTGLRAVMLPVFVVWFILALHGLISTRRMRDALSASTALGLSIYTYTSAFALWGGLGGLVLALAASDRSRLRALWRPLTLTAALGLALSVPMIAARLNDPQGFNRSSSIARPLNDALDGRPQELLDNGIGLFGMAAFTGDPEWRYNVADRPLFVLPVGLAVYAGLSLLIYRMRRQPIYAALLGIMAAGLLPSLLTVSAPSFLRSIALLPGLILCAALALDRIPGRAGWIVGLAGVGLTGVLDAHAYFVAWPNQPEVYAIYRDDLEQLARVVREDGSLWLVSTPDVEQDALMFSLYAGDAIDRVAFFDGDTTVALAEGARIAISPLSALTPPHQPFVSGGFGASSQSDILLQNGALAFEVYQVEQPSEMEARIETAGEGSTYLWPDAAFERGDLREWASPMPFPVNFGGVIELAGVEVSDRDIALESDGVNIQLYLRPQIDRPDLRLNVFVHVYRRDGTLHAQRDLMGMPSSQWLRGVTIVQDNFVIMGPSAPGRYIVAMGVYNYETGDRLPVLNEDGLMVGDRVLLGRVRVVGENDEN